MDASAQELQPRECIWDSIKAYRFMDKMHFEKCFPVGQPSYKDLYEDDEFMYRLVILSEQHSKLVPSSSIPLYEHEWRSIGIRQSAGWQHMACYR